MHQHESGEPFVQPTPVVGGGEADTGEEDVMDLSQGFGQLLHNQLAQTGIVAQNNFVTVAKAQDYDYLENKRMVTLDEAVGIREVQSQVNPGGPAPRS